MRLCVTIGNTNTCFGLFDGTRLAAREAIPTAQAGRLPDFAHRGRAEAALVASVAPSRTAAVCSALNLALGFRPLLAGEDFAVPIEVRLPDPQRVGVDRLLGALAAFRRTHSQTIVVDAGTAVTVNLVSASGAFCGGAIAPGPALMLRAMHEGTEGLPDLAFSRPAFAVGRDTAEAMRSGAFWGAVGVVERLIRQIRAELLGEVSVVGTGGALHHIAPHVPSIGIVAPDLVLEGLGAVEA
jgi:type III pantothenate kinase